MKTFCKIITGVLGAGILVGFAVFPDIRPVAVPAVGFALMLCLAGGVIVGKAAL